MTLRAESGKRAGKGGKWRAGLVLAVNKVFVGAKNFSNYNLHNLNLQMRREGKGTKVYRCKGM